MFRTQNPNPPESSSQPPTITAEDVETVLFAHGDPWRDGAAELVDRARELAAS